MNLIQQPATCRCYHNSIPVYLRKGPGGGQLKTYPRHRPGQQFSSPNSSYISRLSRLLALGLSVQPTGRLLWWTAGGLRFILDVINNSGSAPVSCARGVPLPAFHYLPPPLRFFCVLEKECILLSPTILLFTWLFELYRCGCYDWTHWKLLVMHGHFGPGCFSWIYKLFLVFH